MDAYSCSIVQGIQKALSGTDGCKQCPVGKYSAGGSSTSCSSVHDLADGQHLRVEVSCGSSWRKKRTSGWLVNCPAIVPEFGRMSDTPFSVSCRCYPFPCVALPSRF